MKVKELLEELEEQECYKRFKSENKDSFFCAGFFVLDLAEETEKISLDFYLKDNKKIASFEFPFNEVKIHEDEILKMNEQGFDLGIDICDLKDRCVEILRREVVEFKLDKIIAILKDDIWNLTCMGKTLNIFRIKINAKTAEEISFEKVNFFDMARIEKK